MPKRILSGMRPTAKLHLGNLLGALDNWKKFEGEDSFFMIADWHALTTEYASHVSIKENVIELVIDYLAAGLKPDRSTIFLQSLVPEHAELALLLSMITPLAWLERNPTYKDQIAEQKGKDLMTHGFLGYPVLQAADILLYIADAVPVGDDQLPHLELAREIARKFHYLYKKEIFPEPEAIMTKTPRLLGVDSRKMSKSYGNAVNLSDTPGEVKKKIKSMITDPQRIKRQDPGHPDICNVYSYYKFFFPELAADISEKCKAAEIGCVEDKEKLADCIVELLKPIQERRDGFLKDRKELEAILEKGARKAQAFARGTLDEIKKAVGI